MRPLKGSSFIYKGAELEAWYDSLAAWIRKHCKLQVASHSYVYLGQQAHKWHQAGGRLQALPHAPLAMAEGCTRKGCDGIARPNRLEVRVADEDDPEVIKMAVTLLLLYDKSGQREAGWAKFLELADESRYPGTDEASLAWLRADVAHFTKEHEAGAPFTPNDYGCER